MKTITRKKKSVHIPNAWTPCLQRMLSLKIKDIDKEIISTLIRKGYTYSDIDIDMLETRKRKLVDTNSILCKIIQQYFKLTYQEIGSIFGKHHATIIHYVNNYEDVLCLDSKHKAMYNYLVEVVNQTKFGAFDFESYDINSKNYAELKNAFHTLVNQHKILREQLTKIKSILDV
tara:strand:- start:3799 stop:4320 length:522 start_codon:yes stop_codon:yes gene_type:complete